MISNNISDTSWKAIEYWGGAFFFIDKCDGEATDFSLETIRNRSIESFINKANKYLKQSSYKQVIPEDIIDTVVPKSVEGKTVKEKSNLVRKYVKFPLLWVDAGRFKCKAGIRVNFCASPNLSKIFVYLISANEKGYYNNTDLFEFKKVAVKKIKEITDDVSKIYKDVITTDARCSIKTTSYYLELCNIGTTEKNTIEFAGTDNIELMKQLLDNSNVKKAYYTMLSLAGGNFDIKKDIDDLKKELKQLPKQALVPSYYQCDDYLITAIYAQPDTSCQDSEAILIAGITAIDISKIDHVNWDGITSEPDSPFCRVRKDLTPLEAWHHATSHNFILSYAAI